MPAGTDYYNQAKETVKERWVEQGIWNDNWNDMAQGRRRHEELLDPSSESEQELPQAGLFSLLIQTGQRRKDNRDDGRAVRKPECDATRPFHQFMYQVSKERERVGSALEAEDCLTFPPGIHTQAYDIVKGVWTKRGTWDATWGILPGMSWKHERPLERVIQEDTALVEVHPLGLDTRTSFD